MRQLAPVVHVERVHLEFGEADEEPRPGVLGLVLLVVADHVAHVLAHEALDALAEFLATLDVDLLHPVATLGLRAGLERRHRLGHLVVERDVRDEVPDDGERLHRRHGDRLAFGEGVHARHAQQPGQPVDLGRARAALAGLAVPAAGEVGSLVGLDPVDDVEDDLALHGGHDVIGELPAGLVTPPHPHGDGLVGSRARTVGGPVRRHVGHGYFPSSKSARSSAGISGRGSGPMAMGARKPRSVVWRCTKLTLPISGSGPG